MSVDVLVVGGGLAGSLAAWRLVTRADRPRVRLLERGTRLGGNHTWSFHDSDLDSVALAWLDPIIASRWQGHEVRFPGGARRLAGGYLTVTADRLHATLAPLLGDAVRYGVGVAAVARDGVTLDDGTRIPAGLVLDARGAAPVALPLGWQTFVGHELELEADHGLRAPVIMDATVPQVGGFRFVYLLPFAPRTLLVEDTLYADSPMVDHEACRRAIASYVDGQGWRVRRLLREEAGALPIPLGGRGEDFWPDDIVRIGMRAGLFHPTTGYSLPDAVRTADLLRGLDLADADGVYRRVKQMAVETWERRGFFRLLNRLLFRAARPDERRRVMELFYRRPEPLIARFYAGRLTWVDRARILTGRPPVSVVRALAQVRAR